MASRQDPASVTVPSARRAASGPSSRRPRARGRQCWWCDGARSAPGPSRSVCPRVGVCPRVSVCPRVGVSVCVSARVGPPVRPDGAAFRAGPEHLSPANVSAAGASGHC